MAHPPECEDEPWHTPVALQECAHGERTRNLRLVGRDEVSLGELIHQAVRRTIDQAVDEELRATQGAAPYERRAERNGYRNGAKTRTLTGPTGPVELTLPRGRLTTTDGATEEWRSTVVPRYQRRMREVNEAVAGMYLSGGNTRRIRGALRPLLKNAPLSKRAVSRIVATLRGDWKAWSKQSLADLNVVYLYLDAIALRVRAAGRVTGLPAGRRRRPQRRGHAAREPRGVRRRVGHGMGGLPPGPDRPRLEGAAALHHRRERWPAPRDHARVAGDEDPALRGAQAPEHSAQGASTRARRDHRRLPPDRLRIGDSRLRRPRATPS